MNGTIICYGDSNTWGYDPRDTLTMRYPKGVYWTSILEEKTAWDIRNYGECGREIPHTEGTVRTFVQQLESWRTLQAPVQLWIMLGSNDLIQISRAAAEDVAARMDAFLEALQETDAVGSGAVSLTLIAPPLFQYGTWVPKEWMYRESRRIPETYRALAKKRRIGFINAGSWEIPVLFDGVHLTEEGHRSFASHIIEEAGL